MARPLVPDQHSREHAARMLADHNYPTAFERASLMGMLDHDYRKKTVGNLIAMLDQARLEIQQLQDSLSQIADGTTVVEGTRVVYSEEELRAIAHQALRIVRADY